MHGTPLPKSSPYAKEEDPRALLPVPGFAGIRNLITRDILAAFALFVKRHWVDFLGPESSSVLFRQSAGKMRSACGSAFGAANLAYSWTQGAHCRGVICKRLIIVYNIPT